jgi:hypothetical protein
MESITDKTKGERGNERMHISASYQQCINRRKRILELYQYDNKRENYLKAISLGTNLK